LSIVINILPCRYEILLSVGYVKGWFYYGHSQNPLDSIPSEGAITNARDIIPLLFTRINVFERNKSS
jgi:hypothetical protein